MGGFIFLLLSAVVLTLFAKNSKFGYVGMFLISAGNPILGLIALFTSKKKFWGDDKFGRNSISWGVVGLLVGGLSFIGACVKAAQTHPYPEQFYFSNYMALGTSIALGLLGFMILINLISKDKDIEYKSVLDKLTNRNSSYDTIDRNSNYPSYNRFIDSPKYTSLGDSAIKLKRIQNTGKFTILHFGFKPSTGAWFNISINSHLRDSRGNVYEVLKVDNCPYAPCRVWVFKDFEYSFSMYFEALPEGTKTINFYENDAFSRFSLENIEVESLFEKKTEVVQSQTNIPLVQPVYIPQVSPVSPSLLTQSQPSKTEQIKELKALLDGGALTQEEFETEKGKVLGKEVITKTETPIPSTEAQNNINALEYKFCTQCGQKIPGDSVFCSHCGKKQSSL